VSRLATAAEGVGENRPAGRSDAVVQGVAVGQGDAVGREQGQQLPRSRWGTEEERLAMSLPGPPPLGDAALEVQPDQVGLAQRVPDLRGDQGLGRRRGQGPGGPPGPAWCPRPAPP
jgi:hypothetical protein